MAYDNSGRADAARRTRARVVEAAREQLLARGWAGTTIRSVAADAGVSRETVYKTFGGKAGLLKAVYDRTLAGDDAPVVMAERPLFASLRRASTAAEAARAYADVAAHIAEEVGPLLRVALSSRGADPQLREFAEQIDAERLAGVRQVVRVWGEHGWLRPGRTPEATADVLWTIVAPTVHELLHTRGWSRRRYRDWVEEALGALVLVRGGP
ncbi:TetR/AcrR family transcriptional regulator [Kineococcus gynurae]|uniref:TetR/AcrR family transcriptional regulator n=1 Tax=Kineococcus gynurae TaxID=452979 RepID=A0ABV5LU08_9ACTN